MVFCHWVNILSRFQRLSRPLWEDVAVEFFGINK